MKSETKQKWLSWGDVCLSIEYRVRGGKWGWPWAGRLLAASWRVQSVGAAGACLAWLGGRRGKTGRHKIKSNRTQACARTHPWPRHYKRQHSNMSNIWFAKCSQQTETRTAKRKLTLECLMNGLSSLGVYLSNWKRKTVISEQKPTEWLIHFIISPSLTLSQTHTHSHKIKTHDQHINICNYYEAGLWSSIINASKAAGSHQSWVYFNCMVRLLTIRLLLQAAKMKTAYIIFQLSIQTLGVDTHFLGGREGGGCLHCKN